MLVLGQYLHSLGLIDERAEQLLHEQMLEAARDAGADTVVFKPHPAASPTSALRLAEAARRIGLELEVYESSLGAEVVALKLRPLAVVSCFSTALVTCSTLLGIPAHAVGTAGLLQELAPFENSNRIPLTLVDAMFVQHDRPGPGHCSRSWRPRGTPCSPRSCRNCTGPPRPTWAATRSNADATSSSAGCTGLACPTPCPRRPPLRPARPPADCAAAWDGPHGAARCRRPGSSAASSIASGSNGRRSA